MFRGWNYGSSAFGELIGVLSWGLGFPLCSSDLPALSMAMGEADCH